MMINGDNWRDHAACLGEDPELFQPEHGNDARKAIIICRGCPVRIRCLRDALECPISLPGIYGGTGKRERDKLRIAGRRAWPKLDAA